MLYWPRARQRDESAANGAFSMKRSVFLALISLALVAGGCGGGAKVASLGSDDVAVVGSKQISKEQFQVLMGRAKIGYDAQDRPFPKPGTTEYESLKSQAIAFLLQRAEFEQEAEDRGIDITDEKIDKRIAELKKQFTDKGYTDTLKKQGLTEEQAREEVRASLISEELSKKITEDVTVSDQEIKSYYDNHPSQYLTPASREVRHILVLKKPLADQLYAQLKSGANFAVLAKRYSKDPGSASNGGKLTVSRGRTVPEFDKAAFKLKKGQISAPIKTQYGYHIIQALSDIKPAQKSPLSQQKAQIKQTLEQQQKQDAMTKWVAKTKKYYCGDTRIKYQVGYQPATDPCLTVTSPTATQ
jgi:parvulin-like peptidyl-prolyl isomerase